VRIHESIEKVPILLAIGVTKANYKRVLGLQSGYKESASCWREFYKDLKRSGLEKSHVELGIMNGLKGELKKHDSL